MKWNQRNNTKLVAFTTGFCFTTLFRPALVADFLYFPERQRKDDQYARI